MNPENLAGPVRLDTDRLFRLPTVVRPALFDAISFEDTESALARLFGGLLPAEGARHVVADPGGSPHARAGDLPPVRFDDPRTNRTGAEHPAPRPGQSRGPAFAAATSAPSTPDDPHRTTPGTAPGGDEPVTRLAQGAAALAQVLRGASGTPWPDPAPADHRPSTLDRPLRPGPDREPEPVNQVPTPVDHQEPDGPGPAPAGPVRVGSSGTPDGTWQAHAAHDLAGDLPDDPAGELLTRLLDLVELDFDRSYGPGEW